MELFQYHVRPYIMTSLILSICDKVNPRKKRGAYRNYSNLIKKFKKNGIWNALSKKISLEEIYALHTAYKIPKSTIRSWNQCLLADSTWIPNHARRSYLPKEVENMIAEMIMELYEERSLPLSNTTVKRIARSYYDYLVEHYSEQEKAEIKLPSKFAATARWLVQGETQIFKKEVSL